MVSDRDYPKLRKYEWYLNAKGYVIRNSKASEGSHTTYGMGREILGAPKHLYVDHKNRDILDNRRSNLRLATHGENCRNSSRKAGLKGIRKQASGRYAARVCEHHLGTFDTLAEAVSAYNQQVKKLYGKFACLNKF